MIEINWKKDYRVGEFACPNPKCNAKNVRPSGSSKGKKRFQCSICKTSTAQSINLNAKILSQYKGKIPIFQKFNFEDNLWDLRTIASSYNARTVNFTANFSTVKLSWFRSYVKKYIYQLCITNKSFSYILSNLSHLRFFSQYLSEKNLNNIEEINRSLIIDFISWDKSGHYGRRNRLLALRDFFILGHLKGFFALEQDLVRKSDLPKQIINNPDCISDYVREQIEQKLHLIPEPIARMWFVAFFSAMRPSELALLKKNCLVQEGDSWKIIWQRGKTKDYQEIPVTRVIAKVIQEQQIYIESLWGDNWDYLFCDYQNLSRKNPGQPNFKPVKKILHKTHNALKVTIKCLIEAENIRDENDKLSA